MIECYPFKGVGYATQSTVNSAPHHTVRYHLHLLSHYAFLDYSRCVNLFFDLGLIFLRTDYVGLIISNFTYLTWLKALLSYKSRFFHRVSKYHCMGNLRHQVHIITRDFHLVYGYLCCRF